MTRDLLISHNSLISPKTNIVALIDALEAQGVHLTICGPNQVAIEPADDLDHSVIQSLKANKQAIIDELNVRIQLPTKHTSEYVCEEQSPRTLPPPLNKTFALSEISETSELSPPPPQRRNPRLTATQVADRAMHFAACGTSADRTMCACGSLIAARSGEQAEADSGLSHGGKLCRVCHRLDRCRTIDGMLICSTCTQQRQPIRTEPEADKTIRNRTTNRYERAVHTIRGMIP